MMRRRDGRSFAVVCARGRESRRRPVTGVIFVCLAASSGRAIAEAYGGGRRPPLSRPIDLIPPEAYREPPLRGNTFSVILPFYPPQVDELRASMATLSRHLEVEDVDQVFLSSPCGEEVMTRAALTCTKPPPKESRPVVEYDQEGLAIFENKTFLRALEMKRGRLDWMPEWRTGDCRKEIFHWLPRNKITHLCDDAVMCGKVRGCLLSQARQYRGNRMPLGWYIQQLVKLGLARFTTSSHMLILDADTYAVKAVSATALLNTDNGTSKLISSRKVHKGTPLTSELVGGRWAPRYSIALDLLHANRSAVVRETTHVLGVTPEVMSTALNRRILDKLEAIHHRPWYNVLAYSKFTEFSLYNTYLLLEWNTVGRGLHDVDLAKRKRQLSIWAHDLDDVPADDLTTAYSSSKRDQLRAAEAVLKSKMILVQHAALTSFFICQDESGLRPDECAALANCAADIIRDDPDLKRIKSAVVSTKLP